MLLKIPQPTVFIIQLFFVASSPMCLQTGPRFLAGPCCSLGLRVACGQCIIMKGEKGDEKEGAGHFSQHWSAVISAPSSTHTYIPALPTVDYMLQRPSLLFWVGWSVRVQLYLQKLILQNHSNLKTVLPTFLSPALTEETRPWTMFTPPRTVWPPFNV